MRYLKAIELTNIVCYDHARLPLDREGITCIYGRNKDGGLDDLKSNGAGKSLLLTMLAETMMDQNPVLDGRHVVKESFFRKGAVSAVEFDDYKITKQLSGKTPKFELYKQIDDEWVPSKTRTKEYVTAKMGQLMPIGTDEFFTLYYVDSNRQSALQRGSHAKRLDLFSKLFNLDQYDLIQAQVKERLKVMRKLDGELQNLLNQIALVEPQIPADLDSKVEDLEAKQKKQRKLNQRRAEANRLLQLATTFRAHQRALTELNQFWHVRAADLARKDGKLKGVKNAPEPDWFDPEFLQELISALNEGGSYIKKKLAVAYEQQAATHKIDDARKRVADLEKATKGWTLPKVKEALNQARDNEDLMADYRAELKEIDRQLKALIEVDEPEHGYEGSRTIIKTAFPGVKLEQLQAHSKSELNAAQAIYDMAVRSESNFIKKFADAEDGCECPTCHNQLDDKTLKMIKRSLAEVVKDKKKALTDIERVHAVVVSLIQWMDYNRELATLTNRRAELTAPEEHDGPDADTLSNLRADLKRLDEERATLTELEALVEGEPLDVEELSDRRMAFKQAALNATSILQSRRALQEAHEAEAGDYDLDDLQEGLDDVDKTLDRLMKDVPALTQQVSLGQAKQRELKDLMAKKRRIEEQLFDQAPLKALDEAYGQKGLKNLAIQRVSSVIESNLNANASLLLAEKMRFEIRVSETEMHILAHREYGGESSDADIRRFSGAESRAVNMLLAMSILPLIPSDRRLNIMALDEPTANLDPPAIELFTDKFLPKLLELVPHVIVLSPERLNIDMDAETWCVTRENGRSVVAKEG